MGSRLRWRLFVTLTCMALAGMARAALAANLLSNGSFEIEAGGMPIGWEQRRWSGDATLEITPKGHQGKQSITIASDKGADFSLATSVPVEPFATYRLSGWIKTENVSATTGRGAMINIQEFDSAASPALTGTHSWTRVEVVFNTCGQDRVWVHCLLGGWGQATGKAWYDDLILQQVRQYRLDYSYLFRRASPGAPRVAHYGGQTAIAEHAFQGPKPRLDAGKQPIEWRLICGPDGMTVDRDSGVPSWPKPTMGHHRVFVDAKNAFGHDILEFILLVVRNDIPDGRIVHTKHMDFVLPPEGEAWFEKWKPHATLDAQFAYLRKLIGHEPARDGKQVVEYRPDMGGGAHSGNPAMAGPGWWRWGDVDGWVLGIWPHEVGHNFNAQAPITFYSNVEGFDYHHHCHALNRPMVLRTLATPAAFGLCGAAADNYRQCLEAGKPGLDALRKDYQDWLLQGGNARGYKGNGFHLWIAICDELASQYGVEWLEKTLRAMRTDGVPRTLRETAKTPLQVNALLYCIMSHAAGADLRPFFDRMRYEYDEDFYRTIDAAVRDIVKNLPDEDDLDGWKKNPHKRTLLPPNDARHELARGRSRGAPIRRAPGDDPQRGRVRVAAKPLWDLSPHLGRRFPESKAAGKLGMDFGRPRTVHRLGQERAGGPA